MLPARPHQLSDPAALATATVAVRGLRAADSLEHLTALLHRAYRGQVEMGLRPLAGRQDVATTRRRTSSGECFVATLTPVDRALIAVPPAEVIVGTILFNEEEPDEGPAWFRRPEVDSFSLFAVEPALQGRGIGRVLLERVEARALENGATELALSMAEPDTALLNFYLRLGYRLIEHWRWPYTNYRSAILSRTIGARP